MLVTAFAVLSIAPAAYGQGTLTVVKSPAAGGTVTAVADDEFETPLIACGSRCSAPFATQEVCAGPPYRPVCHDEVVGARLQATAAAGWTVRDFSGCTAVANACSVSGGQNRTVTVRFWDAQPPTVGLAGPSGPLGRAPWTFTVAPAATSGIANVEFLLGGSVVQSGGARTWTADPSKLPPATTRVEVTARVTTNAGRVNTQTLAYDADLVAPTVTVTAGPPAVSAGRDPRFEFLPEPGATVRCGLNVERPTEPCQNPVSHGFTRLPDGDHVFVVTATDAAGNVSDVARYPFTVDTTAPDTAITEGRADGARTSETSARFEFASERGIARFECSLDGQPFAPCASPYTVTRLAQGAHRFRVRAIDAAGNVDPTPASRGWTVIAPVEAPPVVVVNPPAAGPPDADGDGFNALQDCDDADPARNPGARDVPGSPVDLDCDGALEPWPRLRTTVRISFEYHGRATKVADLALADAVRGSVVTVVCKGRGCAFKSKQVTVAKDGKVSLRRLFKGRRLAPKTRIEVAVRAADAIGPWVRFVTRVKKVPARTDRCLVPGIAAPGRC